MRTWINLFLFAEDGLVFGQVLFDLHFVLPFIAQKSQRGGDTSATSTWSGCPVFGMREHAQIENDGLDAIDAFFDVLQNFGIFRLLLRGEKFAFVAQRIEAGRGKVQRIVDFVNDSGAHAAERRQLLGLHQLRFGFLELLDGGFEQLGFVRKLFLVLCAIPPDF